MNFIKLHTHTHTHTYHGKLKYKFLLVGLFLLNSIVSFSQSIPYTCGNEEPLPTDPPLSESGDCFDIDSIMADCIPIYLRVNVHYFLEDDCSGTFLADGGDTMRLYDGDIPITNIDQGFEEAESLITRANDHFGNADSMRQFQSSDPPGQGNCVPIRWVLNDVIFHCDTYWKEIGVNEGSPFPTPNDLNNVFGINTDTEYNIYIMTHNEASGEANGLGGSANSMVVENFSRGLFNHEMGHVLGLRHSWGDDRIPDTPETGFRFDLNCDGTISWDEENLQCWNNFATQTPIPSWEFSGGSFPNACDAGTPCADQHPCCGWTNQNNNFMAYNSHNDCCGACTHGQIEVMLKTINDYQCDYIEDIGGDCPPPMANIELLPVQNIYETNCSFCFYIGASMNETAYKMEFFEAASHTLIHTTGLLSGPAPKTYCIDVSGKTLSWANGFQAGTDYIARLTVENGCGNQKEKEISFTLPPNCIPKNPPAFDWLRMPAPNPHSVDFSFEYEIIEEGELEIFMASALAPEYNLTIVDSEQVQPGIYEKEVSSQSLPYGIYALIVRFNNEVQSVTILKQAP